MNINSFMGFLPFQNSSLMQSQNGYVMQPQTRHPMMQPQTSFSMMQQNSNVFMFNFLNINNSNPESNVDDTSSNVEETTSNTPAPGSDRQDLSSAWGNTDVPFNWADIASGLFGNIHGTNAINNRYVADRMPTANQDATAPGNTWAFTTFKYGQTQAAETTNTVETTNTAVTTTGSTAETSNQIEPGVVDPYSRPDLSEDWGNTDIPFGWADVSSGLFGNVHGVNSIINRYVADNMPTANQDPTAPGNTWAFTTFKY